MITTFFICATNLVELKYSDKYNNLLFGVVAIHRGYKI